MISGTKNIASSRDISLAMLRLKAYATCIKDLCKYPIKLRYSVVRIYSPNAIWLFGDVRSFGIIT